MQEQEPTQRKRPDSSEAVLPESERAEQAVRLFEVCIQTVQKSPEATAAITNAFFIPDTEEGRALKDGYVAFQKGDFQWEFQLQYHPSHHTEVTLAKSNTLKKEETGAKATHEMLTIRLLDKYGSNPSRADITFLDEPDLSLPYGGEITFENTPSAIRRAEKLLADFRNA